MQRKDRSIEMPGVIASVFMSRTHVKARVKYPLKNASKICGVPATPVPLEAAARTMGRDRTIDMAHMQESFQDRRRAMRSERTTPASSDTP